MEENNYKNIKISKRTDLEEFLEIIARQDINVELFAMGGTAMVLAGIKESTKDVDFMTTANYETIQKLFSVSGFSEKSNSDLCNVWYYGDLRIDIFYNEFILGISLLDDWKEKSIFVRKINNVEMYILNWFDLIITKLSRSEQRDVDDIIKIIRSQNVDLKKLKDRFFYLSEISLIHMPEYKFWYLERAIENDKRNNGKII